MKPSEILDAAANIILRDGWHQGTYFAVEPDDSEEVQAEKNRTAPCCQAGAISRAVYGVAWLEGAAMRAAPPTTGGGLRKGTQIHGHVRAARPRIHARRLERPVDDDEERRRRCPPGCRRRCQEGRRMTGIEDLERWHRLYEQGIDPDHDCHTWPTACVVCGNNRVPPAPTPRVNRKKLAGVIGGILYYVVASLLLMQAPDIGAMAWILVPPMSLAAWLLVMIAISLFWDLLGWMRE